MDVVLYMFRTSINLEMHLWPDFFFWARQARLGGCISSTGLICAALILDAYITSQYPQGPGLD